MWNRWVKAGSLRTSSAKRDAPGALTLTRAASIRLTTSLTLSSAERRRITVTDRRNYH